jgi:hypothetical protein
MIGKVNAAIKLIDASPHPPTSSPNHLHFFESMFVESFVAPCPIVKLCPGIYTFEVRRHGCLNSLHIAANETFRIESPEGVN